MIKGIIASLVTNFTADGELDEDGIQRNITYLADSGVHGVCIAGGTGEALALTPDEYRRALWAAAEAARGRVFLIAGALYVDPNRIVECCAVAKEVGAEAVMVIPPYFVRPSSRQLEQHFRSVADRVDMPLILFNTPSRAGVDMDAELVVRIAEANDNIVGIKEASGSITRAATIVGSAPDGFAVLQGLDDLVFPTLAMGGSGALVSLATILPGLFSAMYRSWEAGDFATARDLQLSVLPLLQVTYAESNPVGLKRLLDLLGRPGGLPREPLHPISTENEAALTAALDKFRALESQHAPAVAGAS